jgi:GTP-binding protein HflX
VSLAGYTSAGKTTLFNSLTGESHDSGKGMFTTLATYTRALQLKEGKVLLSDTVGFISKLPAYMIEAFKSTLDELTYANLVMLVIDISEPLDEVVRKYDSSIDILNELHVPQTKILNVLNKIDLTSEEEAMEKAQHLDLLENRRHVMISSKTGYNIERLKEMVNNMIFDGSKMTVKDYQKELAGLENEVNSIDAIDIDRHDRTAVATTSGPSYVLDPLDEMIDDESLGSKNRS